MNHATQPVWFALKVRTGCERRVSDMLLNHLWIGRQQVPIEVFIPVQKAYKSVETGEIVQGQLAVTSLLFVNILPEISFIDAIRHSPNVYDFYNIPHTNQPEPISEEEIHRLQQILNESLSPIELVSKFRKGDKVRVTKGSLQGLTGILDSDEDGQDFLYVEIKILQQYLRVRINRADVLLCDSVEGKEERKSLERLLLKPEMRYCLDSFNALYQKLTASYLKNLSEEDLCALVSFYQVLSQSRNALLVFRSTIWERNKYRYQDFFAKVYVELASRVKANRNKAYRAPLLHALHCLCYQVSDHAYSIKTDAKWVSESIRSIAVWFMTYKQKENNYDYVRLISDLPSDELSQAIETKTWTRTDTVSDERIPKEVWRDQVLLWYNELTEENIRTISSNELAQRMQLLALYATTVERHVVSTKKLKALMPLSINKMESMTDVLLLCDALNLLYQEEITTTTEFAALQQVQPKICQSIPFYCFRAICDLHNLEHIVMKRKR